MEKGSSLPTEEHSAKMTVVFLGTLIPAYSAIQVAGLPTTAVFSLPSFAMNKPSFTFSSGLRK